MSERAAVTAGEPSPAGDGAAGRVEADLVIFDLDGTLIDTVALIRESHRHAVRTVLGRELPDEALVAHVGRPLMEQMEILSPRHADELYRVYREWNHANTAAMLEQYEGIDRVVARLAGAGLRLAIATSKSRDAVELALAALPEIRRRFPVIVCQDDTARHKPDPEPLLLARARLEGDGAPACYVGDSPYDLRAARAAGMAAIAVTWGFFPEEALAAEAPDAIARHPGDLLDILGR